MPHAIIEHSPNLEHAVTTRHILHVVHGVMETSGLFSPSAIKTRRHICDGFLIGQTHDDPSFLHITVYMMEGRSLDQKQSLSERLFNAVNERLPDISSLTVDIRDMTTGCYRKK